MTKVLVFGTFDGLHEGHKDFFRQSKEFGDPEINPSDLNGANHLIVLVGRDSTVIKTKGRLPKLGEQERLKVVQQAPYVVEAQLGNEGNNPYKVIEEIKPDVICLGYDQTHFVDKLEGKLKEMGLNIEIKRLNAFEPEKYHSSLLNKQIIPYNK